MNVIKKTILVSTILITQLGCSQKLTLNQINSPSKKNFERVLKEQVKPYKETPEIKEEMIKQENYLFEIRLKSRNEVINKYNLLNSKKIIIIDRFMSGYAGLKESNFIFHDDSPSYIHILQSNENEENYTYEEKNLATCKNCEDITNILNYFNEGISNFPNFDAGSTMPLYYITVVKDGKVNYYRMDSREKFKAVLLN